MVTGRPFLVRELIEDSGFELELVAGAAGADRECRGVYVGEHLDPTPWMAPGSVHLTAGLALADCEDPAEGSRLLRRLHTAGMVGLGVSIPHYLPSIPVTMREEADRLGLPLFSVTGNTLFRDIEQYVYDALASEEMHRLRRGLSAQQQLLEIMVGEEAPAAIARRLSALLEATVLLLDPEGGLLAGAGPARTGGADPTVALVDRAWAAYQSIDRQTRPQPAGVVGANAVLWRDVVIDGRARMVLMAVLGRDRSQREFVGSTLDYAQRLLEVDVRRRFPPQTDTGSLVLQGLLRGEDAGPGAERLALGGISEGSPYRLVVVRPRTALHETPVALVPAGVGGVKEAGVVRGSVSFLGLRGVRFLLAPTSEGGAVALLATGRGRDVALGVSFGAELASVLAADGEDCVVGSSEECLGASRVPVAYAHALQAVAWLGSHAAGSSPGAATSFELLGPRRRLLDRHTDAELEELTTRFLGPLRAVEQSSRSPLVGSLESYLRHDRSIADAACELRVHRNSLCKRLARIERILAVDLGAVDDIVDVRLAFEADDILWSRRAAAAF